MKTNKQLATEIKTKVCELNQLISEATHAGLIVEFKTLDVTDMRHSEACYRCEVTVLEEL